MKRFIGLGILVLFSSAPVHAKLGYPINWVDRDCFQVGPIQMCKPSRSWDTQKAGHADFLYKWVLHRKGPNPVCRMEIDEHPHGKTANAYAKWLRAEYRKRGFSTLAYSKKVIAGRNVSFITGIDRSDRSRYLVGIWRTRDLGIRMECSVHLKDFARYEPQFVSFIESGRIVIGH